MIAYAFTICAVLIILVIGIIIMIFMPKVNNFDEPIANINSGDVDMILSISKDEKWDKYNGWVYNRDEDAQDAQDASDGVTLVSKLDLVKEGKRLDRYSKYEKYMPNIQYLIIYIGLRRVPAGVLTNIHRDEDGDKRRIIIPLATPSTDIHKCGVLVNGATKKLDEAVEFSLSKDNRVYNKSSGELIYLVIDYIPASLGPTIF